MYKKIALNEEPEQYSLTLFQEDNSRNVARVEAHKAFLKSPDGKFVNSLQAVERLLNNRAVSAECLNGWQAIDGLLSDLRKMDNNPKAWNAAVHFHGHSVLNALHAAQSAKLKNPRYEPYFKNIRDYMSSKGIYGKNEPEVEACSQR